MPPLFNHALSFFRRVGPSYRPGIVCRPKPTLCHWPRPGRFSHQPASSKAKSKGPSQPRHGMGKSVSKQPASPMLSATAKNMVDGQWNPLAKRLASKSAPSILYESPSKSFYVLGCYAMGGICLGWAGFQLYDTILYPTHEVSLWIRNSMGGVCAFMALFGLYFTSKVRPTRTASYAQVALLTHISRSA